jgi:TatA/E family protein of Tat protein translocase
MHYPVLLFFSNLFSSDMIIIVFVALLLFGGEKLPEIARGLGKGIRDFKDASEGVKREINNQINSFEEKREEKRLEEAAVAHQEGTQNETPANISSAASLIRPAENAIPVSDVSHTPVVHNEAESHPPVNPDQLVESHVNDPGKSEAASDDHLIKNS